MGGKVWVQTQPLTYLVSDILMAIGVYSGVWEDTPDLVWLSPKLNI